MSTEPKKPPPTDDGMMPEPPDPDAKKRADERLSDEISLGDADAQPFAKARALLSRIRQRDSKP